MHSWSDAGTWSPCCYTDDHAESQCMWDKPRELTDYPGDGFEISYGAWGMPADPAGALAGWQSSPPHREVILNAGMWSDAWQAVGIGIRGGYASVWFGVEAE
jgi:hypothetical protein